MAQQIQLRRGTAVAWTAANPILLEGEMGAETDTGKYKIGNGSTAWNALAYGGVALASTTDTDLDMAALAGEPSLPAAGRMKFYAKNIAGRIMAKIVGPSGVDVVLQPGLFGNAIKYIVPSSGTGFAVLGWAAPTAVGTVSTPAIAAGGLRTQASRSAITSAGAANSAAEIRSTVANCWRGDIAGVGGFHLSTTFAMESTTALQRLAVGLFSTTNQMATTQSPSALTNCVFAGWDSADTSLQIMHNDASGTCTKIALGANFPVNTPAAVYQLDLFAPPGASTIGWRVKRLDTGHVADGVLSTDLPVNTQMLTYHMYANNGGTAAAVIPNHLRTYLETDV